MILALVIVACILFFIAAIASRPAWPAVFGWLGLFVLALSEIWGKVPPL